MGEALLTLAILGVLAWTVFRKRKPGDGTAWLVRAWNSSGARPVESERVRDATAELAGRAAGAAGRGLGRAAVKTGRATGRRVTQASKASAEAARRRWDDWAALPGQQAPQGSPGWPRLDGHANGRTVRPFDPPRPPTVPPSSPYAQPRVEPQAPPPQPQLPPPPKCDLCGDGGRVRWPHLGGAVADCPRCAGGPDYASWTPEQFEAEQARRKADDDRARQASEAEQRQAEAEQRQAEAEQRAREAATYSGGAPSAAVPSGGIDTPADAFTMAAMLSSQDMQNMPLQNIFRLMDVLGEVSSHMADMLRLCGNRLHDEARLDVRVTDPLITAAAGQAAVSSTVIDAHSLAVVMYQGYIEATRRAQVPDRSVLEATRNS